jgi:hypothetical protein
VTTSTSSPAAAAPCCGPLGSIAAALEALVVVLLHRLVRLLMNVGLSKLLLLAVICGWPVLTMLLRLRLRWLIIIIMLLVLSPRLQLSWALLLLRRRTRCRQDSLTTNERCKLRCPRQPADSVVRRASSSALAEQKLLSKLLNATAEVPHMRVGHDDHSVAHLTALRNGNLLSGHRNPAKAFEGLELDRRQLHMAVRDG